MNIQLNGETKELEATNLEEALTQCGFMDAKVATALNGEFVPEGTRQATALKDGDRLEVLAPMQGG